jgi:hypothetical protein
MQKMFFADFFGCRQEQCTPVQRQDCSIIYDEKCSTTYEDKCDTEYIESWCRFRELPLRPKMFADEFCSYF